VQPLFLKVILTWFNTVTANKDRHIDWKLEVIEIIFKKLLTSLNWKRSIEISLDALESREGKKRESASTKICRKLKID